MAWTILDDGGTGKRAAVLREDAIGNDKTFDFDAETALLRSRRLDIEWVVVDFNPSADVGNRGVVMELMSGNDVLLTLISGTTVAASVREVSTFFHQAANSVTFAQAGSTAFTPNATNDPLPRRFSLFSGLKLRIRDPNAIAAGDTIKVRIGGRLL